VTDQQQGPIEIHQQFFKQLQGFQVQVVGRFVQYQYVGRLGEQLGQQQSVALATRKRLDRLAAAFGWKQKVTQVTDYVLGPAVDLDLVGTTGDIVDNGFFEIELIPQLIEIGNFQTRAEVDTATVGLEFPQQQIE